MKYIYDSRLSLVYLFPVNNGTSKYIACGDWSKHILAYAREGGGGWGGAYSCISYYLFCNSFSSFPIVSCRKHHIQPHFLQSVDSQMSL